MPRRNSRIWRPSSSHRSWVWHLLAPSAPPAPQVEVIPVAPSTTVVWQPGRWQWSGAGWNWMPGHYEARPQPASVWVPGQWQPASNGGYSWVEGHWQ